MASSEERIAMLKGRLLAIFFLVPFQWAAGQPIRADARLVLVPVSVTDQRGATVNGLDREDFAVFDDKVPQDIVAFSAEDAPSSVGLIFDVSGSMKERLSVAKEALRAFVYTANPADEAFLFTVSTRPETSSVFSSDLDALVDRARFAVAGGDTALIDTIYAGLERMRSASNPRRALLILSDGMDNHSRHSRDELLRLALEADVQIYTICIDSRVRTAKPIEQQEEQRGLALLQDLAENTGGLHFTVSDRQAADAVVARAVLSVRNQYVLAYHPAPVDQPGKWHKIRVKLNLAHLYVNARSGYYAR
jgi:Ca-activated chloride channel family protein